MANINLNNYFRKSSDIKSPIDSKILLNKKETDEEYYGDLKLDLVMGEIKERPLNAKEANRDIQRIVNEESVIVALRNIFNTFVGSRLLNPEMSFEIKQYLFEPLTEAKAWFLGYDICQQLPLYEPRVSITGVTIDVDTEKGCYVINLSVSIPSLDADVDIRSILNSDGYSILG